MNRPKHARRWLAASTLLFATHCGGAQPTPTVTTPPPRRVVQAPPPAIDTSAVPAPEDLVGVVRIAPVGPLVERVAALSGLPAEMLRGPVDEAFHSVLGDPALGDLADRNAPVDFSFVVTPEGRFHAVVSFAAPAPEDVESRLGQTHRFVPTQNGMSRIQPVRTRRDDENNEGLPSGRMRCTLAPTPRPTQSRIVCSESNEAVDIMAPYLARTLTRQDMPANTVTAELAVDAVRARYGSQATAVLDAAYGEIQREIDRDPTSSLRHTAVREIVMRLMRELLDNARSVVNEGSGLSSSLAFGEDRVTWHWVIDVRNPTGTWVRAFRDSLRPSGPVPADLLTHLLPEGWAYAANATDARPLRDFFHNLAALTEAIAESDGNVPAADAAALRQALEALLVQGRCTTSFGAGFDAEGELWGTATTRCESPAQGQAIVAATRNLIGVLRRPAVARWINTTSGLLNLGLFDVREVRELPARGLPAGAYGFSVPSLSTTAESAGALSGLLGLPPPPPSTTLPAGGARRRGAAGGRAARAPRRPPTQVVVLASGNDVLYAMGTDAAALLARYQANMTPGVEVRYLTAPDAAIVEALVPAGLPNSLRARSSNDASELQQTIARMPDQGRTPIVLRLGSSESEGVTHFTFDIDIHRPTLAALPMLFAPRGSSAPPPPPPPPPSPRPRRP